MRIRNAQLRNLAAAVLATVIVTACSDRGAPTEPRLSSGGISRDQTISEGTKDYDVNEAMTCGDAAIDVTGHGTLTYRTRADESGGLHFDTRIDESLSGTDVAAVSYSGKSSTNNTMNVPGPNFETTSETQTILVSQGGTPNHTFHTTFHITVSANGNVPSTVLNYHCS